MTAAVLGAEQGSKRQRVHLLFTSGLHLRWLRVHSPPGCTLHQGMCQEGHHDVSQGQDGAPCNSGIREDALPQRCPGPA